MRYLRPDSPGAKTKIVERTKLIQIIRAAAQRLSRFRLDRDHQLGRVTTFQIGGPAAFAELSDRYGSDKGSLASTGQSYDWPPHTYSNLYSLMFDPCRDIVTKVFECGIGTNNPLLTSSMGSRGQPGASLRAWRDYFPKADIFGADIDREILFQEDRIHTYWVDQTSAATVEAMWSEIDQRGFDLMIDDGLHEVPAGLCLFEYSIDRLSDTGTYVIEDVTPRQMIEYRRYFKRRSDLWVMFMIREDAVLETKRADGGDVVARGASARKVSLDNGLVVIRKISTSSPIG